MKPARRKFLHLEAYAVTSDARLVHAPDTPTFSEMGLHSVSFSGWVAMFAPKNVPQEIIGKLNAAAVDALADQGVRSRLADLGFEVYPRERQTRKRSMPCGKLRPRISQIDQGRLRPCAETSNRSS